MTPEEAELYKEVRWLEFEIEGWGERKSIHHIQSVINDSLIDIIFVISMSDGGSSKTLSMLQVYLYIACVFILFKMYVLVCSPPRQSNW